jgi:hypothetical protein
MQPVRKVNQSSVFDRQRRPMYQSESHVDGKVQAIYQSARIV